ncbi:MAG: hypothetical protein KDA99_10740, partial [Planctomycetales bacterium]|nr:hypothetical protein [Planctomycetales bacterium]
GGGGGVLVLALVRRGARRVWGHGERVGWYVRTGMTTFCEVELGKFAEPDMCPVILVWLGILR